MELKDRHCTGCDITKPIKEFTKDKYDKSGYTYRCKSCRNRASKTWRLANQDKVKTLNLKHRETRKEYYNSPETKLKYRKAYIERTFKISYSFYEKLLDSQKGVCSICSKPETSSKNKYLSVDHDHSTGKIRGLLCNSCNRALGYFYDNIKIMKNAIKYLKNYESFTSM